MNKDVENDDIPKRKNEYNDTDFNMPGKNAKVNCVLVYGLSPDEYNRISRCTMAKRSRTRLLIRMKESLSQGTLIPKYHESRDGSLYNSTNCLDWLWCEVQTTSMVMSGQHESLGQVTARPINM
ncbi:hypothetical protein HAX54_006479 [Datura stramonium]|uniref:Uncharacterized protein n=1 Tax=Datura stramonium TaxID=4076 RepID=A0ABS8TCU2_DATST|nr:hypothetical protein [Datura stramonium]